MPNRLYARYRQTAAADARARLRNRSRPRARRPARRGAGEFPQHENIAARAPARTITQDRRRARYCMRAWERPACRRQARRALPTLTAGRLAGGSEAPESGPGAPPAASDSEYIRVRGPEAVARRAGGERIAPRPELAASRLLRTSQTRYRVAAPGAAVAPDARSPGSEEN